MLEHLPDPSTKGSTKGGGQRPPPLAEAAEGRLPLWTDLASVQAASTKHQATRLLGYEAIKAAQLVVAIFVFHGFLKVLMS